MHHFSIAFGLALDRSSGHLGHIWGAFWAISHWCFQYLLNIVIFEQMTVQNTCVAQLDPIWAPKRVPRGAQDELKTNPRRVQNRVQNRSDKMIEKWTAQGSMPGIGGAHVWPQVPTGGGGEDQTNNPKTNTTAMRPMPIPNTVIPKI